METIYTPQKEKHYSLDDWMIRNVINCKILQWKELQETEENPPERSLMDKFLGRGDFPSKDKADSVLNMLSDENLNDVILLMSMGETLDVNLDLNLGEERFLDYYQRHPELAGYKRFFSLFISEDKKFLPTALRIGQLLLELPKGTDISVFPNSLFDWRESASGNTLRRMMEEFSNKP